MLLRAVNKEEQAKKSHENQKSSSIDFDPAWYGDGNTKKHDGRRSTDIDVFLGTKGRFGILTDRNKFPGLQVDTARRIFRMLF